jgi:hypothetical protein
MEKGNRGMSPYMRRGRRNRGFATSIMSKKDTAMKKILGAGFAMVLALGLAGQVSAAATQSTSTGVVRVAAGEYDYPPFGSQNWWDLQGDRG